MKFKGNQKFCFSGKILNIFYSTLLLSSSCAFAKELTLTTFNAGLADDYMAFSKERRPLIKKKLKALKGQVLCLQEVWDTEDQKDLVESLKKEYPYSFYTPTKQKLIPQAPACKIGDLLGKGKFLHCIGSKCLKSGQELTDCVVSSCRGAMDNLSTENKTCAQALFSQVGKNPIISFLNVLNPFYRAGLHAFEGSTGLVLLSKVPLEVTHFYDFKDDASINKRGALYAKLKHNGKTMHLACTHLSANLAETIPYVGNHASWEQQNRIQAQKLSSYLSHKAKEDDIQVIMGDLNSGLKNQDANTVDEFPRTLKSLYALGFREFVRPQCTFCNSNYMVYREHALKGDQLPIGGIQLDHILIKNLNNTPITGLVHIKENYALKISYDGKEKIQETPLSDHYAVSTTLFASDAATLVENQKKEGILEKNQATSSSLN